MGHLRLIVSLCSRSSNVRFAEDENEIIVTGPTAVVDQGDLMPVQGSAGTTAGVPPSIEAGLEELPERETFAVLAVSAQGASE